MATILEVARKAGVAPSTVSFVISGHRWVSDEVKATVNKAIAELQYKPRKRGRPSGRIRGAAPAVRRKKQILFLVPYSLDQLKSNLTYFNVLHGVETACNRRNLDLILCSISQDDHPTRLENVLAKTDGCISLLVPGFQSLQLAEYAHRKPIVRVMGRPHEGETWDHVTYNNHVIGRLAGEYLLARGHRHCAYFSHQAQLTPLEKMHEKPYLGTPATLLAAERREIFTEVIEGAGGSVRVNAWQDGTDWYTAPTETFPYYFRRERMVDIVRHLLQTEPRPTALFVFDDETTVPLYIALLSLGIRPGTDVEIISCNNTSPLLASLTPRPCTIDINTRSIGQKAVQALLDRLEFPELPQTVIRLTPRLIPSEDVTRRAIRSSL